MKDEVSIIHTFNNKVFHKAVRAGLTFGHGLSFYRTCIVKLALL